MIQPENEESRPGQRGRHSQNHHQADDDPNSVPADTDTLVADRWAAHVVRSIVRPYVELCAHCASNQRHPGSPICLACLEIGAGDVWSGDAA